MFSLPDAWVYLIMSLSHVTKLDMVSVVALEEVRRKSLRLWFSKVIKTKQKEQAIRIKAKEDLSQRAK